MYMKHDGPQIGLYALLAYPILSYALSLHSVCGKLNNVAFGYAEVFTCDEIIQNYYILFIQIFSIIVGYFISNKLIKTRIYKSPRIKNKSVIYSILLIVQYVILLYFVFSLITAQHNNLNHTPHLAPRALSTKSSQALVMISTMISIIISGYKGINFLSKINIAIVIIIFSWIDGSRTSLIPLIVYSIYYIYNKNVWSTIVCFVSIIIVYNLSVVGRVSFDKDIFSLMESFLSVIKMSIFLDFEYSYIFQFSYLHFMYTISYVDINFYISDFIYSIVPLPSNMHFIDAHPELWRVDAYRPYGGMAEIFYLGYFYFILYNFLIGGISGVIDKEENSIFKTIAIGIIVFAFVASFQYGTRTIQWFVYAGIAIIIIYRRFCYLYYMNRQNILMNNRI